MVDDAASSLLADDAVRLLLMSRIDDAYRTATFILHDRVAAEDAVQEAALIAWDRRRTLRDPRAADGWFGRIVTNVCRDELRRRTRRPHITVLDQDASVPSDLLPDPPDLGPALARLAPDEQALLALRFGRECTVPEIAAHLGIPEGTVKSRLHATLQHLRAAVDAERRSEEARR